METLRATKGKTLGNKQAVEITDQLQKITGRRRQSKQTDSTGGVLKEEWAGDVCPKP